MQHSFAYLLARIIPACLVPLSIAVFIRTIGPAEYGRFSLIYALVLTLAGFATQWVSQPILRFQSKFRGSRRSSFTRAVRYGTILSLILATGTLLVLAPLLTHSSLAIVIAAILALAGQIDYGITAARIQAELRVRQFVIAETTRVACSVGAAVVAVFLFPDAGTIALLVGNAAGSVAGSFILRAGTRVPAEKDARRQDVLPLFLSYGWRIAIWAGLSVMLNLSDRYVIARFGTLTDVGNYSAVYDLMYKGIGLILTPVVLSTHALVMAAWNSRDNARAALFLRRGIYLQLCALPLILIGCWFSADLLCRVVLGIPDPAAARLVSPIAAGAWLWQFSMLAHKPMELAAMTGTMAIFGFCALMVNLSLNVWLIPGFGYVAAAYTTAASALVYLGLVLTWQRSAAGKRVVRALSGHRTTIVSGARRRRRERALRTGHV